MSSRRKASVRKATTTTTTIDLVNIIGFLQGQIKRDYGLRIVANGLRTKLKQLNRIEFDFFQTLSDASVLNDERSKQYETIRVAYGLVFRLFDNETRDDTNRAYMLSKIALSVGEIEKHAKPNQDMQPKDIMDIKVLRINLGRLLQYGRRDDCLTIHCARILSWKWLQSTVSDMPIDGLQTLPELVYDYRNPTNMYDEAHPYLSMIQIVTTNGVELLPYLDAVDEEPIAAPSGTPVIRPPELQIAAPSGTPINRDANPLPGTPVIPQLDMPGTPIRPLLETPDTPVGPPALNRQTETRSRLRGDITPLALRDDFEINSIGNRSGSGNRKARRLHLQGAYDVPEYVQDERVSRAGIIRRWVRDRYEANAKTIKRGAKGAATAAGLLGLGAIGMEEIKRYIPSARPVLQPWNGTITDAVQGTVAANAQAVASALDRAANLTANAAQRVVQQSPVRGFVPTAPSVVGKATGLVANAAQRVAQQSPLRGFVATAPSVLDKAVNLTANAVQGLAQQSPLRGFVPTAPTVLDKAANLTANAVQKVVQQSPLRGFVATAPSVLDKAANLTANAVQGVVQQSPLLGFVPTAPSVATGLTANAAQRAAQQLQVWGGGSALTTIPALNQATNLTAGTTPRIAGLLTDGRETMGVIAQSLAVIQDVASSLGSLAANSPWWTAAGLAATGLAGYAINRRFRNRQPVNQPLKRVSKQSPAALPLPPSVVAQRKSLSKKPTQVTPPDVSDLPALLPLKSRSKKAVEIVAPAAAAATTTRPVRPKPILKKPSAAQTSLAQAPTSRTPRVRNDNLSKTKSSSQLRRAVMPRQRRSPRGGTSTTTPTPANRRRPIPAANRRANTGGKTQQAARSQKPRPRRSPATTSPSNRRRRAAA